MSHIATISGGLLLSLLVLVLGRSCSSKPKGVISQHIQVFRLNPPPPSLPPSVSVVGLGTRMQFLQRCGDWALRPRERRAIVVFATLR